MTTYKILGQEAPVENTECVLYITPASNSTLIRSITITNVSSFEDYFDIALVSDSSSAIGDADYLFKSYKIFGNETVTIKSGYTMAEGNSLRVRSNNGTCTFHAFGGEF